MTSDALAMAIGVVFGMAGGWTVATLAYFARGHSTKPPARPTVNNYLVIDDTKQLTALMDTKRLEVRQ